MSYRFDFRFVAPKKQDLPDSPHWYIHTSNGAKTEYGHAVTPTDSKEQNIDIEIDKLIAELNEIRKKIKAKYASCRR